MGLRRFPTSSGVLYYGRIPSVMDLKYIKENKFDAIWNLASELNVMVPYEKQYVNEVIFGNIDDYEEPKGDAFLSQLNRVVSLLKAGKKVFVHCYGGHGRTGTALAAIKVVLDHADTDDALRDAYDYARGPESDEQKSYVNLLDNLYNGRPRKPKKEKDKPKDVKWVLEQQKLWENLLHRRDRGQPATNLNNWPDEDEEPTLIMEKNDKSDKKPK